MSYFKRTSESTTKFLSESLSKTKKQTRRRHFVKSKGQRERLVDTHMVVLKSNEQVGYVAK